MPDGLDRVHHLGDVRHTSRYPQRRLVNRLHVHVGAIEHREAGIAVLEREEEIGPAEQNDLGALLSAQALAGSEKHAPLRIVDPACGCHRHIVVMHLVKLSAKRNDHRRRRDCPVQPRLHHHARADDAYGLELSPLHGNVHFRDTIQNGQWRHREKLADAEVPAHGGDGSNLRAGRLEPRYQSRKYSGLLSGILVCKVVREVAHLSVRDRQLQSRSGPRMAVGQAAVVVLGCGRSNAADQSDMHLCTPNPRYDVSSCCAVSHNGTYQPGSLESKSPCRVRPMSSVAGSHPAGGCGIAAQLISTLRFLPLLSMPAIWSVPDVTRGDEMLAPAEAPQVFPFENSYARLPERFFARLPATPVRAPRLVRLNEKLARQLGLDPARLSSPEGVAILAGNTVPELGEPLAMAYAGHQFGSFVPQLGDGRALLLGEVVDLDGVRRDIQLKGSGPTPFSRNGDGRAALGPVLREYIISEAMHALGIPTTRSLAVVTTGQTVRREELLPGAVLTRVASSHVRVGTFQFFAARGDGEAVLHLADYVIARHYPEAADAENPYRVLLDLVITRQAKLIAKWLLVGFIHGVMNTDNMSIAGETIDYGPCAFMDAYDPATVYSSIDSFGRYAYGNQPRMAQWNLARLADTLLPLLADDEEAAVEMANEFLGEFAGRFDAVYALGLQRKLGLFEERQDDRALAQDLLDRMARNGADFTLTFRRLSDAAVSTEGGAEPVHRSGRL